MSDSPIPQTDNDDARLFADRLRALLGDREDCEEVAAAAVAVRDELAETQPSVRLRITPGVAATLGIVLPRDSREG